MILPLVGNIPEDKFCYEVHVYTGIKANSETDSNVHMVVAGTNSDTGILKVADGQRKVLNIEPQYLNIQLALYSYNLYFFNLLQ